MSSTLKKTLMLIQTGATNGHKPGVKATLLGLGLGRIRASRELEDTPAIRGMIFKVRHLVTVGAAEQKAATETVAKPVKTAKK